MKKTLLLVALIMAAMSGWCQTYNHSEVAPTGQTLYYNVQYGTATVVHPASNNAATGWTGFTAPTGALAIPATVNYQGYSYPVTTIGREAFSGCTGLTSVTLPTSMVSIDGKAFKGCIAMSTINLHDSIRYIQEEAFMNCTQLTSITIGRSVIGIYSKAFGNCTGVTSVSFNADSCVRSGHPATLFLNNSNVDPYYQDRAFVGCSNIQNFTFGNNVKIIPPYLCADMVWITSITIPSTVKSIGFKAFDNCIRLNGSLTIPASVSFIGFHAFYNCRQITSIIFNAPNCATRDSVNCYPAISSCPFDQCVSVSSISLANNMQTVPESLCQGLNLSGSLTIPTSVTSIQRKAFYNCGLTINNIPQNITYIGDTAFYNCRMASINVPNSCTWIGDRAFYSIINATDITIGESVFWIGDQAFGFCNNVSTIHYNATNCLRIGAYNSYYDLSLTPFYVCPASIITFGDNVTSIPENLFRSPYYPIDSLTLGSSITSIGANAFTGRTIRKLSYNCSASISGIQKDSLTTVTVGPNITAIAQNAFNNCTNLATVNMKPTVAPTLGANAFNNNAPNRVFNLTGCSYDSYASSWASYPSYVSALREPIIDINVTVNSNNPSQGSVAIQQVRGRDVRCDSTVVIVATPNSGYYFDHWSTGDSSNPLTLPVTNDITITAYFTASAPTQYTITANSNNSAMGTVTGGGSYNSGATATLTAAANSGYHFTHWQDNNTQNPRTIAVTGNATYTAYFEADVVADTCLIATFPYTMGFEITDNVDCWTLVDADGDGGNWFTTSGYSHSGSMSVASASYDNNVGPLTPNNWLISPAISLPANSQIQLSWFAKGLDASDFAEYYSVYVSTTGDAPADFTSAVYSGTTTSAWVQQAVNLSTYAGQTVHIAFRHYNCTNMFYLDIDDISITTATTPTQYTLTVNSANPSMGSVTGGGSYNSGATATLTATANNGYHFSHWQDNNTQNPRTVTVTGNATYTAYFEVDGSNDDCTPIATFPWNNTFDEDMSCWKTVDADGDGYNWGYYNGMAYSESYSYFDGTNQGLSPDNWLISRRIQIPTTGNYTLSWKAQGLDNSYYTEHYSVYVSTTGDNPGNFSTQLYSETINTPNSVNRSVSLQNYRGQTVRIAFRHYNTDDVFILGISDVKISQNTQGIDDIDENGIYVYVEGGNIHVNEAIGQGITIYAIDGRVIGTTNNAAEHISFAAPSSGVYIVKIGNHPARKVVVTR